MTAKCRRDVHNPSIRAPGSPWLRFTVAAVAAVFCVLALGEGFARFAPPQVVRDYFRYGEAADGIFRPDPELGADYRSFDVLQRAFADAFDAIGPLQDPTPTWLMFGNSFVQAPGMLADTARAAMPDKRIVNLPRNVDLPLRVAQARLLLDAGLRPQRLIFVLLPLDMTHIGSRPLAYIDVTPNGAITTRARWPEGPLGVVTNASRLAAIAWIRSGRSVGDPAFRREDVSNAPSPRVRQDLATILGVLARSARQHDVPVTVVAIPNREQIFGQHGRGFQAELGAICADLGLDFFDAGPVFVADADKKTLFLPDWHFSERGNRLLLGGLLDHLGSRSGTRD
jgi:hypothetical protein